MRGHNKASSGDYLAQQGGKIAASLPFSLLICDQRFSIIAANHALGRLFRVRASQLGGKKLIDLLGRGLKISANGSSPQLLSRPHQLMLGRNPRFLVGIFPQIGYRVFHCFAKGIQGHWLLVFQDVTEAMKFQTDVMKSRTDLITIFDGLDDPMVMIDKDFKIIRVNHAVLKALGEPSYQPFLGKACYYKLHGRHEPCPGCTAKRTFRRKIKTSRVGLLERCMASEEHTYQIDCHPLRDASGRVRAIAETYRDITDLRHLEGELYESERVRIMEPLAAGIAHEVRNPLAVIRSTAQYCLEEASQGRNGDYIEGLRAIIKNAGLANHVITAFLGFARPQKVDFQSQPLRPILVEGLQMIRGRAKEQKARLICSIPANLPTLIIDKKRFLQAYLNFLLNALEAMPERGRIEVSAEHRRHQCHCVVVIRDTGKGVPQEMVPKLFQPFYSMKKEGVGLGLPIAEGIIRSHGGRVNFRSWEGKGSEVSIILPLPKKDH